MEDDSVLTRPAPPPDLVLAYGTDPDQVADVWRGDPARPLLVILHGGFWRPAYDRAHTAAMAGALRAAGWSVASAEYRRIPGRPTASTDDVRLALATLPARLGHTGMIVIGHSAGGHLALWAAARVAPASLLATIAIAPLADLEAAARLGLSDNAVHAFTGGDLRGLDPMRLPPGPAPVVILHGMRDETVPIAISEGYARQHPAAVRLRADPAAHHYSYIDPQLPGWGILLDELAAVTP